MPTVLAIITGLVCAIIDWTMPKDGKTSDAIRGLSCVFTFFIFYAFSFIVYSWVAGVL